VRLAVQSVQASGDWVVLERKTKKMALALVAVLSLVTEPVFAENDQKQQSAPAPSSYDIVSQCDAPSQATAEKRIICYIPKDTEIDFRLIQDVTTENREAKIGTSFQLETVSPLVSSGKILIPAKTKALGEVEYVDYKGGWGHNATIKARLLYIIVGDQHIPIHGEIGDKGKGGAWAIIPLALLSWSVGGFVSTGSSAKFKNDLIVKGYLSQEVPYYSEK